METWKPIPFAPGYEASDLGRIRCGDRVLHQVRLSPKSPYLRARINGRKTMAHICVLAAFEGELLAAFDGKLAICEVNHKNGIKSDNRLENLEYATRAGNMWHAFNTGLNEAGRRAASARMKYRNANGLSPRLAGQEHPGAKLTEEQVLAIRASNLSTRELAQVYPVDQSTIRLIRNRKIWTHLK